MGGHQARATLVFQSGTDVLGFVSTFEEGVGLPTTDFTASTSVKSSSGRSSNVFMQCDWNLLVNVRPLENAIYINFDQTSYKYLPSGNSTFEDLVMSTVMWTVSYDSAARGLSLWTDDAVLGTQYLSEPPFGGNALFGPNGIETINFGVCEYRPQDCGGGVLLIFAFTYCFHKLN